MFYLLMVEYKGAGLGFRAAFRSVVRSSDMGFGLYGRSIQGFKELVASCGGLGTEGFRV